MPDFNWENPVEDKFFKENMRKLYRAIADVEGTGSVLCSLTEYYHMPNLSAIDGVTTSWSEASCLFGKFEREINAPGRMFLFTPKEGAEIPVELQKNAEQWPIKEAVVHMDEGVIRIQDEDREIVLIDLDLGQSSWDLLRDINKEMIEQKAGVYVGDMKPLYDLTLRAKKMYPGENIPYLSNAHTRAPVTGYAIHYDQGVNYLPYVGFVAHKTIAESLWASLVSNKGECRLKGGSVLPYGKIKVHMTPLKKYNRYHAAMITNSAQVGGWNPDDLFAYILSFDQDNPKIDMKNKILQKFEEIFPFPILPEWIEPIWKYGVKLGHIKPIDRSGDCTGAIVIHVKENWIDVMAQLLEKGDIRV